MRHYCTSIDSIHSIFLPYRDVCSPAVQNLEILVVTSLNAMVVTQQRSGDNIDFAGHMPMVPHVQYVLVIDLGRMSVSSKNTS